VRPPAPVGHQVLALGPRVDRVLEQVGQVELHRFPSCPPGDTFVAHGWRTTPIPSRLWQREPTGERGGARVRIAANGIGIELDEGGDGPPVLLLHGWPDTRHLWRGVVPALHAAGYRTIAPDLRGFGDSDKPEAVEAYGLLQLAGDALAVLDHVGAEQAHVVG